MSPEMPNGRELKEEGIARALGNPGAAPWRVVARDALLGIIRSGHPDPFTSEDVTDRAGQPPHPNQVGAMFNAASRRGWIVRAGFSNAVRSNQHAALISLWTATSLGRAEAARTPVRTYVPPAPVPIPSAKPPLRCPDEGCFEQLTGITTMLGGFSVGKCSTHGKRAVRG